MRTILRDLARQPWRTALTVAGTTIGIFALVVFGALDEHFRILLADSKEYVQGTLHIATKTNQEGENPGITTEDLDEIRSIAGVRGVAPTIELLLDGWDLEDTPFIVFEPKPLVEGLDPKWAERMRPGVHLVAGRWIKPGDERKVMVVGWLARRRGWKIGEKVKVRHREFEIVGIYDAPDIALIPAGIVPFEELRKGLENPGLAQARDYLHKNKDDSFTGMAMEQLEAIADKVLTADADRWYPREVIPERREDIPAIAAEIRKRCPHVAVIEPEKMAEVMERTVALFIAITAAVSVISSIVGGLLIVNTMAMAVVERRREVAIKVAIGASTGQVAREFMLEAATIGLFGALLGILLGLGAIAILDTWFVSKVEVGASLFKVTPRLLTGVVGYGVVLGVVAGLLPALRAARSDPAPGLREL
jgi:cell division protein FtsX